MSLHRYVVCGPPGSGKTSYVRSEAKPTDIVWDFDRAVEACCGLETVRGHNLPWHLIQAGVAMRDGLCAWLARERFINPSVYVIVTSRTLAETIAGEIDGQLVVLPPRESVPQH